MKAIRGRDLPYRQISKLMEDVNNKFTIVPFYTEFWWLSCQATEKIFCDRKLLLLEMKGQSIDEVKDESWLKRSKFLVDITTQLSDLNFKL